MALALACTEIAGDLGRVVAIDIVGSLNPSVEEGDTLQLRARALDAAGDSVPEATIIWAILDIGKVGFTLDTATGLVTADTVGQGRVRGSVDNLVSGIVTVAVVPAPDSVAPVTEQRTTVAATAVASPPLTVALYDLTSTPGQQLALANKPVHFDVVDPPPGSATAEGFFLATTDTVPGPDPHRVVAMTGGTGQATATVRRQSGAMQPDSVIVDAVALTARGDSVVGSPVRFVVLFESN